MLPVRRLHLVFKTHLDVGFTDFAGNVVRQYFEHFILAAIRLAAELRARGGPERFVWTTGAWLIYEYLEQASPPERRRMEKAILAGDIAWHALPFTTHTELMDAGLFRFGLSLSQALDRRFGKTTIAAKMTDVPGHTRGMIPLLAEAGVRFLHIGVNQASHPPDVPEVFVWRHPGGSEIIMGYQKGAYGDFMAAPGLDEALYVAHTSDNLGPPAAQEITRLYAELGARFPQAEVRAGRLDDFAAALLPMRSSLPVVTAEIGDTWIHGVGTDPQKVARFRELLRLRRRWFASGRLDASSPAAHKFQRALLMIPEHTWGMDEKTHLHDPEHFAAGDFRRVKDTARYRRFAASWDEQRGYLDEALAALRETNPSLFDEARAALDALAPIPPRLAEWKSVPSLGSQYETRHFKVAFDWQGALILLHQRSPQRVWVENGFSFGQLIYQTLSQEDYDRYYAAYVVNKPLVAEWAIPDQTKPGMAAAGARSWEWPARVRSTWKQVELEAARSGERPGGPGNPFRSARFLFRLAFDPETSEKYGCPKDIWLEWFFPEHAPEIHLTLSWFEKPASRLPEAMWLSFRPAKQRGAAWTMDKLGSPVDPCDVASHGNRRLHAVGSGVKYGTSSAGMEITTLDAPLVAPDGRALLKYHNELPRPQGGMNFLLYNNVWGTNFPMWSDEDALFRFVLRFS